jgi:hypothetical protein
LGDNVTWVGGTWWELKLRDGWEAHDDPECLTITRSDAGAFQLSSAIKKSGVILPSELEDLCERDTPLGIKPIPFNTAVFHGLTASYVDEGSLWEKFWLASGNLHIYATYNGLPSVLNSELPDVKAMLESLRFTSAVNELPA